MFGAGEVKTSVSALPPPAIVTGLVKQVTAASEISGASSAVSFRRTWILRIESGAGTAFAAMTEEDRAQPALFSSASPRAPTRGPCRAAEDSRINNRQLRVVTDEGRRCLAVGMCEWKNEKFAVMVSGIEDTTRFT
jgi:hypothetical protein